jgi:hypothetical protein
MGPCAGPERNPAFPLRASSCGGRNDLRGEASPTAKLTASKVKEIRAAEGTVSSIARRFSIARPRDQGPKDMGARPIGKSCRPRARGIAAQRSSSYAKIRSWVPDRRSRSRARSSETRFSSIHLHKISSIHLHKTAVTQTRHGFLQQPSCGGLSSSSTKLIARGGEMIRSAPAMDQRPDAAPVPQKRRGLGASRGQFLGGSATHPRRPSVQIKCLLDRVETKTRSCRKKDLFRQSGCTPWLSVFRRAAPSRFPSRQSSSLRSSHVVAHRVFASFGTGQRGDVDWIWSVLRSAAATRANKSITPTCRVRMPANIRLIGRPPGVSISGAAFVRGGQNACGFAYNRVPAIRRSVR